MGAAGSVHPDSGHNPEEEDDDVNQRHEAPAPNNRPTVRGHHPSHSHDEPEQERKRKGKTICREFLKGHCKYGDRCRYPHDQGGAPGDRSHIPCREFAKGNCVFGDRCRYAHLDPAEHGGVDEEIHIPSSSVHLVTRPQLSYEDASKMLSTALTDCTSRLAELDADRQILLDETAAMDPEERTRSMGTVWQYRGRSRKAEKWHAFKEHDCQRVEEEYQRWVADGKSKDHSKCRFELALEGGMRVSLDFHLGTQITVGKGGRRGLQRSELPSKARERCEPYFRTVQDVVGDVCTKLEEVSGQLAGMEMEAGQLAELQRLEAACVEALRPSVKTFVELSIFVAANALLQKLEAVLGEKYANSLGVAEGGRGMRVETVCKAVEEAFAIRAYGRGLNPGQTAWDKLKPLIFSGKTFFDKNMLRIRECMVKFRGESLEKKRRHAFMLAGTLLNEYSEDSVFQSDLRARLRKLFQDGLEETLRCNMDVGTVKSILVAARNMQLGDFSKPVGNWLKERLRSCLASRQPLETVVELVQQAKDLPGLNGAKIAKPMRPQIVEKCAQAILSKSITAEHVNRVGLFQKILGAEFNASLFESLSASYEKERAMLTEWLVAYCEHTGVELPPYCMNANQKEAFDTLQQAISDGDLAQIKAAVIAAKTVPDLKSHAELCQEFTRALEILKEKAHMPPGWNLEDLLGTEKLFRKAPVTTGSALTLFQKLMTSTHQKRWTRDRAARGDGAKIADSFEVSRVIEIQNQASWENYDRRRTEIVAECNPPEGGLGSCAPLPKEQWDEWSGPVMTEQLGRQIAEACRLSPLDTRCNEFLFFHGVKPQVADLIAENHFDISFASKDGMFGAGLYFAEASSKSDEYCQPNEHNEFPIIIVRVILGRPNYIDAPKPFDDPGRRALEHSCMSGSYHSVIGDRIKVSNTYREMIVYDHFQAYPHFILWYYRK